MENKIPYNIFNKRRWLFFNNINPVPYHTHDYSHSALYILYINTGYFSEYLKPFFKMWNAFRLIPSFVLYTTAFYRFPICVFRLK